MDFVPIKYCGSGVIIIGAQFVKLEKIHEKVYRDIMA